MKKKDESMKKKQTVLEDYSATVKIKKQKFELKYKDSKNKEQILDFKNHENPIKIIVTSYKSNRKMNKIKIYKFSDQNIKKMGFSG